MRPVFFPRIIIVVLAALALGAPVAAGPEQGRSNGFQGNASRKKAEPERLRTPRYAQQKKRVDDRKASCQDARFRATSAASELAERAQNLRVCAELQDLSEGCSFEYERLRSAHDSFESALISAGGCG